MELIEDIGLTRLSNSLYMQFMDDVDEAIRDTTPEVLKIKNLYGDFSALLEKLDESYQLQKRNNITATLDEKDKIRKDRLHCFLLHVEADQYNEDPTKRESSRVITNRMDSYGNILRASRRNVTAKMKDAGQALQAEPLAEEVENIGQTDNVAAFIAEPVEGHGVYIPSAEFFPKAQELCRKYGALFIMDEVQTGLGRTGKWFAFQHWNLDPDIVTVAKALSGGYVPCAAFVTTREIHQSTFSSLERCVVHSTTFGRNNLAMVCGLASIDVIEKEGMVENCAKMGAKLLERLNALKEKHSYIKEVRGLGLMIAIEFQEPKGILQKAAWRALNAANKSLFTQMIVTALMDNHRIITQVTCHEVHAVKILPPFIITDAEIDKFIDAFDKVLSEAANPTGALWKFGKRLIAASISDKSSK